MDDNIRIPDCAGCIHCQVCTYMDDMAALCAAIRRLSINRHESGEKVSIETVADYNHLAEVTIKCKHYLKDTPIPRYQDSITTLTNPCDISTSTSTSAPRSTLETTTDYIFG